MISTQNRRGFLKIATSLVGALSIAKYSEPLFAIPNAYKDWIEDKGDFFIVRVPDFKSFANELLAKPVIFLMGEKSIIRGVNVQGFANLYAPKGGACIDSIFDARQMTIERIRPILELKNAENTKFELTGCAVYTPSTHKGDFVNSFTLMPPP